MARENSTSGAVRAEDQRLRGISRSLLIAVGGTGHRVLLDIRQRMIQKYGSTDHVPIVSYLLLDTDEAIFTSNPNFSEAANLPSADKIHTSVHGVDQLRQNLHQYPHLRDWLDPRTLSGDIAQGAGAVRARGRLAYFWNYEKISRRIEEKYTEITKDASKAAAMRRGLQVSEGVTVYIVGSLLGGTGSGMFLDLAYTVRQLLKSQPMLQVVGIFTVPPHTAAAAVDNRPNAYASLLELNHYSDANTEFTAQYRPDQPGVASIDPPFRYTYLVDSSSPRANLGTVDKLVEMIGHSVFLDLTSEFQRQKKSNRDNFDQFLTQPDELGCPQNFMTMGLSAIHFPREKVLEACVNRLAGHIVRRWTQPLDRIGNIGGFTDEEMRRLGLTIDSLEQQLLAAGPDSGESLRDRAIGYWSSAHQQYQLNYPGHGRVVDFLGVRQRDLEARYVDTDPNPDPTAKQRANLGDDTYQMQQNVRDVLAAKEAALRNFVAECINHPHRRHGVARSFLEHANERFRHGVVEWTRRREQMQVDLPEAASMRDQQLGLITEFARDPALMLIPGAKRKEIDERVDTYLSHARRWAATFLEMRAADHGTYLLIRLQETVEALKAELDAYIELMRSLEGQFVKAEQNAMDAPVDVNGLVIFQPGRRVEHEDGRVTFEGGDIDVRFAAYVGDASDANNAAVSAAAARALDALGAAGSIYNIRSSDTSRLRDTLQAECRRVFTAVGDEAVLDKLFERFGATPDRAIEEMRRLHGLSQPFLHIKENAPGYLHHANKEQTIVGVMNGAEPRSDAEHQFRELLTKSAQGIRDGQITNSAEPHQVLFLRERAAFPLRLLEGLETYRYAYEQVKLQGASANPMHTRRDVREWNRIAPPSSEDQWTAWSTFVLAWSLGIVSEISEKIYTAVGQSEKIRFVADYQDQFGMARQDPIGGFDTVPHGAASLQAELVEQVSARRVPLDARSLVLGLCDDHALMTHLTRAVELRVNTDGSQEIGYSLREFANVAASRLPRSLVRPLQEAITGALEKVQFNPNLPRSVAQPIVKSAATPVIETTAGGSNPSANTGELDLTARLQRLKSLKDADLISEDEFQAQRQRILAEL
ncbi:MAG: hypothetical protein RJA02_374 [Armatimonadota bacterium]